MQRTTGKLAQAYANTHSLQWATVDSWNVHVLEIALEMRSVYAQWKWKRITPSLAWSLRAKMVQRISMFDYCCLRRTADIQWQSHVSNIKVWCNICSATMIQYQYFGKLNSLAQICMIIIVATLMPYIFLYTASYSYMDVCIFGNLCNDDIKKL